MIELKASWIYACGIVTFVFMTSSMLFIWMMPIHFEPVTQPENNRPVIGVLCQELSSAMLRLVGSGTYSSYIAASYVKYLEGGGARVVPVWIGKQKSYYKSMVTSLNGILFPGGSCEFDAPHGYAEAAAILYDYAVKLNQQGDYFPLWGTCLGFEVLTYVSAHGREHRCDCDSYNQPLPLEFTPDFRSSRLFGNAPSDIIAILETKKIAVHFHQYCVTEKNMTVFNLTKEWHILSTNRDSNGLKFVTTIESHEFPFYAVMFHPEKNAYEWKVTKVIPHSHEAIIIMQYFANYFVNEARRNQHTFPSELLERQSLIYNYKPTYTGNRLVFEQCYFFTD